MVTFARELLCEVVQEVQPLLEKHYRELITRTDIIKLDPQWDEYALLERLDRFVVFTGRDDGRLVAYSAFFVTRHLHYAGLTYAQNDVFYVDDDCRRGATALRLVRYTEDKLRGMGAQKIVYHAKLINNLAPILNRLGYADEEVMCGKIL